VGSLLGLEKVEMIPSKECPRPVSTRWNRGFNPLIRWFGRLGVARLQGKKMDEIFDDFSGKENLTTTCSRVCSVQGMEFVFT